MAILQATNGQNPGEQYTLDGERWVLGRHPDCDVVIDLGAVSRQHAAINLIDGDYFVEDLNSRNGTFVNDQLVQQAHKLQDGDRLKICDLTFNFYREQPKKTRTVPSILGGEDSSFAIMVDEGEAVGSSTIMSKVDVTHSQSGIYLAVNPEVKLRALVEITQNLGKAISLDVVLPKLLDSLFKIFVQADRGFIILKQPNGALIPKATKHRRPNSEDTARISRTIVNQALETKQAMLSADAASDTRFQMSQSIADFRIRSLMCAPLITSEGHALGVIQIDTLDQRSRFTQDDLDVLAGVAGLAASAIDNAQLHEQTLKQQAIAQDLALARKVQQGLLPATPPKLEGYHFFDFYLPANQVGGDYYDYIQLPDRRMGIVLADVSGKGVSAALLMARLSSEVRFALVSESTPAAAISRINTGFCNSGWEDRFVTMVLVVLDPLQNEVTVVNAGHMAPFMRLGPGKVETISEENAGLPLGVHAEYYYEQSKVPIKTGGFLTMFTDGISEAMNARDELYGLERLRKQVGGEAEDVKALGRRILDDVRSFVGNRAQNDDMCLACFGRDA